jgi:VanZ family protein
LPSLRYRRLWFGAGVLIAVAIAVVCLMPGRHVPDVNVSDKLKHFAAFLMLSFWFSSILGRRDLAWMVLALLAFGGLIELAQEAMPWGRRAEWDDFIADGAGVAAGLVLALTPLGRWAFWLERLAWKRP